MISPAATALRDRLRWTLVAAAATPADTGGHVDRAVLERYLQGPGADLSPRADLGPGAGSDSGAGRVVAHHDAIWRQSGLPMLGFDLYTRPYPPAVLAALLDHSGVAGLKLARLHDAIACQAGIAAARTAGRLAVTGEDRMFGACLMWGAEAALVGIAAAAVPVMAGVLAAYRQRRYDTFVAASARLDRLAAATFTETTGGYVQRMRWIAAAKRRIPDRYAVDPYAPALPGGERDRVLRAAS